MDTPDEQGAEGANLGNEQQAMSAIDMTIAQTAPNAADAGSNSSDGPATTSFGEAGISTDADMGNVGASPVAGSSASDISSSALAASLEAGIAAMAPQIHPAHEAIDRLERLIERVSSDFLKEGQALIAAARAEVDKLI